MKGKNLLSPVNNYGLGTHGATFDAKFLEMDNRMMHISGVSLIISGTWQHAVAYDV